MIGERTFDPRNITKGDMNRLADVFEEYISELTDVMIIPEEIMDDCKDKIDEALKCCRKLIKKLRKGDTSVFKDPDEWEHCSII